MSESSSVSMMAGNSNERDGWVGLYEEQEQKRSSNWPSSEITIEDDVDSNNNASATPLSCHHLHKIVSKKDAKTHYHILRPSLYSPCSFGPLLSMFI